MKYWLVLLLAFVLTACAATEPGMKSTSPVPIAPTGPSDPMEQPKPVTLTEKTVSSAYPDLGSAPELSGEVWLNTAAPLRLADLRGKVVLVDMWTFG